MNYLLDTNIVTAILKKDRRIQHILRDVDLQAEILMSGITYYEIKRGLLAAHATRKIVEFEELCQEIDVIVPDLGILEQASELYADLKPKGRLLEDADIIIAATALFKQLILVSNDSDLLRVEHLVLENWFDP